MNARQQIDSKWRQGHNHKVLAFLLMNMDSERHRAHTCERGWLPLMSKQCIDIHLCAQLS